MLLVSGWWFCFPWLSDPWFTFCFPVTVSILRVVIVPITVQIQWFSRVAVRLAGGTVRRSRRVVTTFVAFTRGRDWVIGVTRIVTPKVTRRPRKRGVERRQTEWGTLKPVRGNLRRWGSVLGGQGQWGLLLGYIRIGGPSTVTVGLTWFRHRG